MTEANPYAKHPFYQRLEKAHSDYVAKYSRVPNRFSFPRENMVDFTDLVMSLQNTMYVKWDEAKAKAEGIEPYPGRGSINVGFSGAQFDGVTDGGEIRFWEEP